MNQFNEQLAKATVPDRLLNDLIDFGPMNLVASLAAEVKYHRDQAKLKGAADERIAECPDDLLPDGPVCPRCGGERGPSGVGGGSWVHMPVGYVSALAAKAEEARKANEVLLDVGDGPDGIKVFRDEQRAIVDHASPDSVYVTVSVMGACATFGPMLPGVGRAIREGAGNTIDAEFLRFVREHGEWSDKQFGTPAERGPLGPIKHLGKEAMEAEHEAEQLQVVFSETLSEKLDWEIVDCFLLVLDAARRHRMPPNELLQLAFEKLEINKQRKWPPSKPGEATEHVR